MVPRTNVLLVLDGWTVGDFEMIDYPEHVSRAAGRGVAPKRLRDLGLRHEQVLPPLLFRDKKCQTE